MSKWFAVGALTLAVISIGRQWSTQAAPETDAPARVAVVFSGGHETEGRDRGRPVVLIAAALGVPEEVFREAFTHVHPARNGQGPTDAEARANKKALMDALAPYGVTDQRLNEVSNYYRYRREEGEMWPTQSAAAYALIKDGKITGFEIVDGGSGYSSPPQVSIPGMEKITPTAQLAFSKEFDNNGAVTAIALPPVETPKNGTR